MARFQVSWLEDRSDEAVLEELRRVAAIYPGQRLSRRAFNAQAKIKSSAVERRFGSWAEATRRAGLPRAVPVYSKAAIVDDLRRVSASSSDASFTRARYSKSGLYSGSCVTRRFGSWYDALRAAGLAHLYAGPSVTARMRAQPGRALENEAILRQIREVSDIIGKGALTGADIARQSGISEDLLRRRFGGVSLALAQAGVAHAKIGRRYSERQVFENLLNVWTHYGRAPTAREMDLPPSSVGHHAYIKRYKGWRSALKAFVERANSDTVAARAMPSGVNLDAGDRALGASPAHANPQPRTRNLELSSESRPADPLPRKARGEPREDRREIGIGLRFKVLRRDHFKCVLCGDSPSRNPLCVLHVDHVIPWSKGGRTPEENLRALCAKCNVGRGNRHSGPE